MSGLTERMDDPFRKEWYEFASGLNGTQRSLVMRYAERQSRRAVESARQEYEALREAARQMLAAMECDYREYDAAKKQLRAALGWEAK